MSSGGYTPVSLQEGSKSSQMEESLIVVPAASDEIPVVSSKPMIEVVAPATLPEGYEFQVQIGGSPFKVKVPPGGIEEGQSFSVPFPQEKLASRTGAGVSIPVGHWRDSLIDVFRNGICHPHCWTSWLCTFLATGQVISRMQFDWTGGVTENPNARAMAFPIIFGIVMFYFVVHFALMVAVVQLNPNFDHEDEADWQYQEPPQSFFIVRTFYKWWAFVYLVLSTVILIRTRRSVRQKYGIPAHEFEDCVCSVFCHCCVAGQLLRHTTDYDVYPATIFTSTGLPSHVPAIV